MTNFQRTAAWLSACGKTPSDENLSVQIGVHLEEFLEFCSTLQFDGGGNGLRHECIDAFWALRELSDQIKAGRIHATIDGADRAAALDALCDCEVTGNGVAYLAGFHKDEADQAVLASNDAKLVDGKPVLKEGGKIGKPEGWVAPELTAFV